MYFHQSIDIRQLCVFHLEPTLRLYSDNDISYGLHQNELKNFKMYVWPRNHSRGYWLHGATLDRRIQANTSCNSMATWPHIESFSSPENIWLWAGPFCFSVEDVILILSTSHWNLICDLSPSQRVEWLLSHTSLLPWDTSPQAQAACFLLDINN